MAMASESERERARETLGDAIADYLRAAEAGIVRDADGRTYTPAALRSLRRTLTSVDAAVGDLGLETFSPTDGAALEALARRVIDSRGLPPSRLGPIVDALRRLLAPAEPRRPLQPVPEMFPSAASPTPTFAMVALGASVSAWIERIIVIAFVLTAIGIALELA